MSSFWTKLLCCQNAYKLCCRLVCHFYFLTSKMFFYIEWDQKKSLNFVWIKTNAFFIDLDRFLQQEEFIEVRLVYGFRQDCRKTKKKINLKSFFLLFFSRFDKLFSFVLRLCNFLKKTFFCTEYKSRISAFIHIFNC